MFVKVLSLLAVAAVAVIAAPSPRALPSGTVTCGDNRYSVSAIEAAIDAGVEDMEDGESPGMFPCTFYERAARGLMRLSCLVDDYPHQYYEYVRNIIFVLKVSDH